MYRNNRLATWMFGLAMAPLAGLAAAAEDTAPSNQALYEIIQAQQDQIEALQQNDSGDDWLARTHIGGYGELHYNNLSQDDGDHERELDFHRFVLFFGHDFSDRIRFRSELELEHSLAGEGQPGEVELEQAYIEFDIGQGHIARGGLFLIPVGILNETHEPPTFYGVERNPVENIIIPATWWAGGAGWSSQFDSGLSFDFAVHEGLAVPTAGGSAYRIRSGRQKTAEANANNLAYTGRLRYTGIPGLELAASAQYQSDVSQIENDGLNDAVLLSSHLVLERGRFGLRALYAQWQLNGSGPSAADVDDQDGWYVEPSVKLLNCLGLYARYSSVDAARDADRFNELEIGANFWPHPNVVIKADLRQREHDLNSESGNDFDGFDLGIGYYF